MMKILYAIGFIALARGQPPPPHCCTPDEQWEANEGFMVGSVTAGVVSQTQGNVKVSFDGVKHMVNSEIYSSTGGKVTTLRMLTDYQQKMQYIIDASKKCTKVPLKESFQPSCVPAEAKLVYSAYIGTEGMRLPIDVYSMYKRGFNISISVIPMQDKSVCAPLGETLFGHVGSTDEMVEEGFNNYKAGIKDPSVFVVPPECNNATILWLPLNHLHPARRFKRSVFY